MVGLIVAIGSLTGSFSPSQMQSAQPTEPFWAITRACAADPVTPPEGFSFPGVIVSQVPEDGVRGLRSSTLQTYYIAFTGSNFTEGGALSPDGRFYAVPYGYIQTAASSDERYIVQELRVITTDAFPQISARMAWKATFQVGQIPPIRWLDNTRFIFPQGSFLETARPWIVQPFEQISEPGQIGDYHYLSPDLTRGFKADADTWGLFDTASGELLARFPALTDQLTLFHWSPDSTQFAAITEQPPSRILQLINRDGQVTDSITDLTMDRLPWNFAWSPDGTRFVYSAYDPYKNENTLTIGDPAIQTLTDTCVLLVNRHNGVPDSGVIWSPDSASLALLTSAALDDPNAQQLLDVASGARYSLGVYAGGYLGWGGE